MALFIHSFKHVIEHTLLRPSLAAAQLQFPGLRCALWGASVVQPFGEGKSCLPVAVLCKPSSVRWSPPRPQSLTVPEPPSWGGGAAWKL